MYRQRPSFTGQFRNSISKNTNKYDSYTPRKRYMKERLQTYQYQPSDQYPEQQPCLTSLPVSPKAIKYEKYPRNCLNDQKTNIQNQNQDYSYSRGNRRSDKYQYKSPLHDNTNLYQEDDYLTSQKKKNSQKAEFDDFNFLSDQKQNVMRGNKRTFRLDASKRQIKKYSQDELCLTPRKLAKMNEGEILFPTSEKMVQIENKLAKLQKMTPRKQQQKANSEYEVRSILKNSRNSIKNRQEQDFIFEQPIVTERQSQLLSKISLDRLVEQREEYKENNQIEVIQDLSHRISSKLQSIIRNFG